MRLSILACCIEVQSHMSPKSFITPVPCVGPLGHWTILGPSDLSTIISIRKILVLSRKYTTDTILNSKKLLQQDIHMLPYLVGLIKGHTSRTTVAETVGVNSWVDVGEGETNKDSR